MHVVIIFHCTTFIDIVCHIFESQKVFMDLVGIPFRKMQGYLWCHNKTKKSSFHSIAFKY